MLLEYVEVYPQAMSEVQSQSSAGGQSSTSAADALSDHIVENIESVVALQRREWEATTASQRHLERICRFVGRPGYLVGLLALVVVWIGINSLAPRFGFASIDPPPFVWLDALLTLVALLTTTVILITQNRQTKLEQQRAHLDLQVNLLTEQKVTKLIHLLEELRRDLPMVKDRHDAQANALQERADTAQLVSALDDVGLTSGSQEVRLVPSRPARR